MKRKVFIILLIPGLIFAQDLASDLGFLKLGVGGRACAMGEAFTAVSDDGTASFWNPAGLGNIKGKIFHLTHNEWFMDSRFEYASAVIPTNFGVISPWVTYLTYGEIEGRDIFGEETEPYSCSDLALGISYGKEIAGILNIGIGAKFIKESIEASSGNCFAVDIGVLFKSPLGLNVGAVLQNIGTSLSLEEEKTSLPASGRLGVSYNKGFASFELMPVFDLVIGDEERGNIGLEIVFLDILSLRGGYIIESDQNTFTTGVGILHKVSGVNITFDYAYNGFSDLGVGHRVSLGIGI